MKKDRLEEFILQNRAGFDNKTPDRSIWLSIENKLDKQKDHTLFQMRLFKIAAGIVLILGVGILIGLNMQQWSQPQMNYATTPELLQLKDAEAYYKMQVSLKFNEVRDTATKKNVSADLKQLDQIYQQLKEEMIRSDYSNSQLLIDAMIKNQKTKIEILESILNKQNQLQHDKESLSL